MHQNKKIKLANDLFQKVEEIIVNGVKAAGIYHNNNVLYFIDEQTISTKASSCYIITITD